MPRASTISILTLIFVASTLTYASVASSLMESIILPSEGIVTYTSPFTIVLQVGASHDDAGAWWDWAGYYWTWTLDKSHVSIGGFTGGSQYNGGLRFTNVNIPQGAAIVAAVLKVCADQTCEGTGARWDIFGQNSSDCVEFSTYNNFLTRPKTTATIDTGFFSGWIEGQWYTIEDTASIIQEIVNGPDWVSGNALALLLFGHTEARTTHEIRSYDANPSQAAVLEVTYETV